MKTICDTCDNYQQSPKGCTETCIELYDASFVNQPATKQYITEYRKI